MRILKDIFLVNWIPAPVQESLKAQLGSCPPGTLHPVILANLTTVEQQGLPVGYMSIWKQGKLFLVGKAGIRISFLVAFSLQQI